MVIMVRGAPIRGAAVDACRAAFAAAAVRYPAGLSVLAVYRLDRRFPLAPGFDSNVGELIDLARTVGRVARAIAVVLEFQGFAAAAMRGAIAVARSVVQPATAV